MLAAVSILPDSSMDFPDGAQRFNWCNCQSSVKHLSGYDLSETDAAILNASRVTTPPAPRTPLVDFNFWGSYLRGGGGATATPPAVVNPFEAISGLSTPVLFGGAALVAAVLYFAMKGGKGKR